MIELSRYIPLGQYINNGSPVARLDPRTKLVSIVFLIACITYARNFSSFVLCLIFCLFLQRASQISILYVMRSLRPMFFFLLFACVMEVLFYVPAHGTPQLWHWWFLGLSWAGIITGLLTIVRVLFLYYLVNMLMFTTSLVDLTDGMEVLFSPLQKLGIPINAFVMILVIALKFVPIFVGELEHLMKAQTARGMNFNQGNLFQRIYKVASLLVPLFASGFKRVKTLSVALEARCFGGRRNWQRSKLRVLQFTRGDILALVSTVLLCAGMVVVTIFSPF